MRPAYITATRSHILATMPRLWVMKISARPCARCRSRSRFRYCAWMVTSRLVVGSSAMSRRGPHEMRDGADDALPHAARHLVRILLHARLRRRDPHRASSSRARAQALLRGRVLVHADRLGHLVADGEQRVERGQRVLQDHRDPLAPDRAASRWSDFVEEVVALEADLAARRCAPRSAAGAGGRAPAWSCRTPTRRRCPASRPRRAVNDTSSTALTTRVPRGR